MLQIACSRKGEKKFFDQWAVSSPDPAGRCARTGLAWYPARRESALVHTDALPVIENALLTFMTFTLFRGVCSDEFK